MHGEGVFSYANCLGSAGQERLLTEIDNPIGMTVQWELLEGAGYATRAFPLCCYRLFLSDSPPVCPQRM